MILLYRTKFRVNRIIIRRDIAKRRFSIWRPSAILNLQNFSHFVKYPTFQIHSAPACQISLKSDDFRLRYSDKTIFKMAAVRHFEVSKFGIVVMYPVLERDSALSYKISR